MLEDRTSRRGVFLNFPLCMQDDLGKERKSASKKKREHYMRGEGLPDPCTVAHKRASPGGGTRGNIFTQIC